MGHISPTFPENIKEVSTNSQDPIDQLIALTTSTLYNVTNQTDAVVGEQHVHICCWKYYQQEKKEGMKSWVLLDIESTTDIFREYNYLTNIKKVPIKLKFMTNEGLLTTNQQGNLKNYGKIWYHPKAISNILILSNAEKKNRII